MLLCDESRPVEEHLQAARCWFNRNHDRHDFGDGEVTNDVVTVCIGCKGFDPVEIEPSDVEILTEAFRVENIDRL
jgi:hypothetical protein